MVPPTFWCTSKARASCTANILVYIKGKGIVFDEPSVVAINKSKNKILAVGNEARDMIGKVPGNISVIRPLKEGVIANYTVTQKMLEFVVARVAGKSFFSKPRIMEAKAFSASRALWSASRPALLPLKNVPCWKQP